MHTLSNCPVCNGTHFVPFLTCKDYTVSQELFHIVNCQNCQFKFTNPIPELKDLGNYYKSEEYISHSNTKSGLMARLYHLVRGYTLNSKLSLVNSFVKKGSILDFGCGTGMFLSVCKEKDWKCVGMEPDSGARAFASKNGLELSSSLEELKSNPDSCFDAITLWHVLEHVTDLNETLTFFKRTLKKDGALFIAVPNYKSYDADFYGEHWAAYDVPRHLYHFDPSLISKLLSSFGFKLEKTVPMKFDSFYVSMLSEKYQSGKINYFKAFLTGLKSNLRAKKSLQYSSHIYVFKHA